MGLQSQYDLEITQDRIGFERLDRITGQRPSPTGAWYALSQVDDKSAVSQRVVR